MMGLSYFPHWLEALLGDKFFSPCVIHDTAKKNEKNIFCLDCCYSICAHCLSLHRSHRLIQIRRYVYHDVVRLDDMEKLIDCSLVQVKIKEKKLPIFKISFIYGHLALISRFLTISNRYLPAVVFDQQCQSHILESEASVSALQRFRERLQHLRQEPARPIHLLLPRLQGAAFSETRRRAVQVSLRMRIPPVRRQHLLRTRRRADDARFHPRLARLFWGVVRFQLQRRRRVPDVGVHGDDGVREEKAKQRELPRRAQTAGGGGRSAAHESPEGNPQSLSALLKCCFVINQKGLGWGMGMT